MAGANQLASAINIGAPWNRPLLMRDVTFAQGQLQHLALLFALPLAGVLVQNIVPGLQFSFIPDRFDFSAPPRIHDYSTPETPLDFTAGDD